MLVMMIMFMLVMVMFVSDSTGGSENVKWCNNVGLDCDTVVGACMVLVIIIVRVLIMFVHVDNGVGHG